MSSTIKQHVPAAYPFENRVLKNLPGERWKDIPGFEGEYEISSLGRVKSLRRWRASGKDTGYYTNENIRKQNFRTAKNNLKNDFCYTVSITLKKHGKPVSRSTARFVYYAFVQPFDLDDKNMVVTYRDGNGKNLNYRNLELTSRSGIVKKSFSLNRKHSAWEDQQVKVRQYTIDGKLVATYPSITSAAEATGFATNTISRCTLGKIFQHHSYRWKAVGRKKEVVDNTRRAPIFNKYLWERLGKPKTNKTDPIPVLNLSADTLPGERWKPIDGTDNCYFISSFGRVKGKARFKHNINVWSKEVVKRLIPDGTAKRPTSCLLAQLSRDGKKYQQSLSRLVYHHFVKKIDLADRMIIVKYKNGHCYDLSPENLYMMKMQKG